MANDLVTRTLKALGLMLRTDKESRTLGLIKVILGRQQEHEGALSIEEIHDALRKEEPGSGLSRASIRKMLRTAVEAGFVRATGHGPQRMRYSSSASAIETGLRRVAELAKRKTQQEIHLIDFELEAVEGLDCSSLAQDVVLEFTGSKQRVGARLVVGAEDIRRAVGYNVKNMARDGSIIRVSVMSPAPFIAQNGGLVPEFVHAILRDMNVRCLVSHEIVGSLSETIAQEGNRDHALDLSYSSRLTVKVHDGPRTYHQVSLNSDCMALIVSDRPLTAAWITREFNSDIIDASVLSFDESWKDARLFHPPDLKGASGSS